MAKRKMTAKAAPGKAAKMRMLNRKTRNHSQLTRSNKRKAC